MFTHARYKRLRASFTKKHARSGLPGYASPTPQKYNNILNYKIINKKRFPPSGEG